MLEPLVYEYRGDLKDLTHFGYLCIVDEQSNVVYSVGDVNADVYYRSASKPIQALPALVRGLHKKYGLSDEEITIFAGSHAGEDFHIEALESILKKTGLTEEMLVMKPAAPANVACNEERILKGLPKRKLYHNCAGKHIALMLVQREITGSPEGYWKVESAADLEVRKVIEEMSECKISYIGIDGCGVPVFGVPIKNIAIASKNMACVDTVADAGLRQAVAEYVPCITKYPHMMRGNGFICTILNYDANIVAKGGAKGVYGFGLKKQRLGVSYKFTDGTEHCWPLIAHAVLKGLNCLTPEMEKWLEPLGIHTTTNDNDEVVGRHEVAFNVNI